MLEPGLNRHVWETQWEDLQAPLQESPSEALPEAVGLVGRMLQEVGLDPDDELLLAEDAGELLLEFRSARETARALEAATDVDPGDVGAAVLGLQRVYEEALAMHGAP